jgi:hypothetical protein
VTKSAFESVTLWSMVALTRYYFPAIHHKSFFSYRFVEDSMAHILKKDLKPEQWKSSEILAKYGDHHSLWATR